MEIKEIDGKKFIEYNEHLENKKKFKLSVVFLILMIIAIVILIMAISLLIQNRDWILRDPIAYGMDERGFLSCQCFDEEGTQWYSEGEGFINQRQAGMPIRMTGVLG